MNNILIRWFYIQFIFLMLVVISCSSNKDYYNSKEFEIKQRQKESLKIFKTANKVRKKCSKRYNKPPKTKRKLYYS